MRYRNLIKIAVKALSNNKTRAVLTMLGMIIGISSVIIIIALGKGTQESIKNEISSMGSNMIMVSPYRERRNGVRQSASSMQSLKTSDYEAIAKEATYVAKITPTVNASGQVINGSNNAPTTMYGANSDYLDIRMLKLKDGTMFTEADIKSAAKVCVVGQTVVDNLFTNGEDPIGKIIRFNSIPMKIIGVLEEKGSSTMGSDQDDLIIAPFTTVQKRILAIKHIQGITASAISEEYTQEAIDEITDILERTHKIRIGDEYDFEIRSMEEIMDTIDTVTGLLTTLLACIAGISLLVGGIGIMNIMYVSVTERIKEIGLRMSIGAKGIHILSQFLIEAIIVSLLGGIIGILFGWAISTVVGMILNLNTSIQMSSVLLSFGICTAIGVFFGWYPAQKAANLNPIDALRYE